MRKTQIYFLLASCFFYLLPILSMAQDEENMDDIGDFDVTNVMEQQNNLGALLGYTKIGDQNFIGMRIQPELSFGKIGFGLDIPLMFNLSNGKFRTEEYKDGVGWLRCVRYFRYGVKKKDPYYIRVGDLTGSYIGYGILLDNYTNSISFEKRKIGVAYDILIGNLVGIEGLYSDIDMSSFNLFAIRPYVKPFGRTRIPIVRTVDLGFAFVVDKNQTKIDTDSAVYQNHFIKDGMKAWSLDLGVMPVSSSVMQLKVYAQFGNLMKNKSQLLQDSIERFIQSPGFSGDSTMMMNYDGSNGFGLGVDFRFKILGNVLRIDTRLERLWYEKYFMPQFYNAGYEFDKDAKVFNLANTDGKKGIYGALSVTVIDKVRIGGSLMIPDNVSETAPAIMTLDLDASRIFEKFILQGQYIKGGLTGLGDALVLDDRSLLNVRIAYRMYKYLVLGMDYKWTWSKMENGTFKATNYISPYFGFQIPLNIGSKKEGFGTSDEG